MSDSYEHLTVTSRQELRSWLAAHHATSPGVWLVTWKAGSGHPRVPYADIVEEALCQGWVDSRPRALDDQRSQLLLTPRRAGSNWSRVNKRRIELLSAQGLMQPAGTAAVDRAKKDGTWTALDAVENLLEPDDLRTLLDAEAAARANWNSFPRSTRRAILEWITAAKTPATRERRIQQTVAEAAVGRRANQWRQPKGT
ncbi:YdeI/OmpD-associated family protein [Streptacidiphilus neutrinimicus]|uniref:YdeI/OmpD-associated family protein n=1 Tax=Streptacidiphilus neutrinimicus TaxID=105420 RepID=UPI0005A6636D|nr:YdeI/OmpD-associated family protein [Streptacidiphilus neutrinimicus]